MTMRAKRVAFAEVIGKTLAGIRLGRGNSEGGCSFELHFTDKTFVYLDLDATVQASATLMRTAADGDYEEARKYGSLKAGFGTF